MISYNFINSPAYCYVLLLQLVGHPNCAKVCMMLLLTPPTGSVLFSHCYFLSTKMDIFHLNILWAVPEASISQVMVEVLNKDPFLFLKEMIRFLLLF